MRPDTDNRWRESWRRFWGPGLTVPELEALAEALAANNARLRQRMSYWPVPTTTTPDCPCREGCSITCAVMLARGPMPTREIVTEWARRFDPMLRDNSAANDFIEWHDRESWEETVRPGLLGEVNRSLGMRLLNQKDHTAAEKPIVVLIAS